VSRAAHAASAASRGGRVVAAAVDDAVDEQGWRAQHLARGHAAVHIPADPLRPAVLARSRSNAATSRPSWAAYTRRSPSSSAFWRWNSSSCISQNPSCRAGPRPLWRRRGRAGGCRSGGNGGTRTAHSRRAAVRPARPHGWPAASTALVIAVLEDHMAGWRTADVIDFLIQRRRGRLAVVRSCVGGHGSQPPVGMVQIRLARRFGSRLAGG
jgi:hypothetical protein